MNWVRWLFATLIMFNILAAYWFSSSAEHRLERASTSKNTQHGMHDKAATLALLRERPMEKLRQETAQEELREPSLDISEGDAVANQMLPDDKLCQLLGPFNSPRSLEQFRTELSARGIESQLLQRDDIVREDFWLIVPPGSTRAMTEQLLGELKQKKIESFIIESGEYQNAISLGFFTEWGNTDNYRKKLAELGVEAAVVLRPHFEQMSWLEIEESIENPQALDWVEDKLIALHKGLQRFKGQPCVSKGLLNKK